MQKRTLRDDEAPDSLFGVGAGVGAVGGTAKLTTTFTGSLEVADGAGA